MKMSDAEALVIHIGEALPPDRSRWTGGWPGEIEAALLDAVFSARATYGTPTSGVRRVITNWRAHRDAPLNDLTALAAFTDDPDRLAGILGNRQRVPGNYTTKAEAAALAATALVAAGIPNAARIGDGRRAREAVTATAGLGETTWETFVLQLGLLGPSALATLRAFVGRAVDRPEIDETDALRMIADAAETLAVDSAALVNAIWRHGRIRERVRNPLSA